MTKERLDEFERTWIAQSSPEDLHFEMFQEPKTLRRSTNRPGALAQLTFGKYQAFDGQWIDDDRAVWIGMLVSERRGDGEALLASFEKVCGGRGLFLLGTVTPLKPKNWDPARRFDHSPDWLLCRYLKRGWSVIKNGSDNRVVYSPLAARLEVDFRLKS